MRSRPTRLALATLITVFATPSFAQIFRCEGADGVVEYTNAPSAGPQGNRECRPVQSSITVIPAPKLPPRPAAPAAPAAGQPGGGAAPAAAAPSAAKPVSPEGFPKVDPAAQRARDSDRRRILEDEQKKEETRLAELRAEFNNGEPERRGDERNYQKYLDRVQRLREDIARTEGNLGAIRKELGLLRN